MCNVHLFMYHVLHLNFNEYLLMLIGIFAFVRLILHIDYIYEYLRILFNVHTVVDPEIL